MGRISRAPALSPLGCLLQHTADLWAVFFHPFSQGCISYICIWNAGNLIDILSPLRNSTHGTPWVSNSLSIQYIWVITHTHTHRGICAAAVSVINCKSAQASPGSGLKGKIQSLAVGLHPTPVFILPLRLVDKWAPS